MVWWKILLIILGATFILAMLIKFVTREKSNSLDSALGGYYSKFLSTCKKIVNFGC